MCNLFVPHDGIEWAIPAIQLRQLKARESRNPTPRGPRSPAPPIIIQILH